MLTVNLFDLKKDCLSTSNSVWSDWLEQDWHIQQSQSLSQFDSDENPGSTVTSTEKWENNKWQN